MYDEDLSFVPEEFYDEYVNRAEQNKELGELRAEGIPAGRWCKVELVLTLGLKGGARFQIVKRIE